MTWAGLLQVELISVLWDEVLQEGCRYAEDVSSRVQARRGHGRPAGDLSVAEVAADFDISEQSVRRWMLQADIDDGIRDGQTSSEQTELVQLRLD